MIERVDSSNIFEQRISLQDLDFTYHDIQMSELLDVASFAMQGGSGLYRLLDSRKLDHQIEIRLEAGSKFLNRVAVDVDRYLKGVDPKSAASKISYSPIPQLESYAKSKCLVPGDKDTRFAAIAMENSVYRLKPLLNSLLAKEQMVKRNDLAEYLTLARPYMEVAGVSVSQFQEIWNPTVKKGRPPKDKN